MENKIKIKNLDELHKIAICNDDIENHIKLLVTESEQKIIEGIQTGLSTVVLHVTHGSYHLLTYSIEDSTKILVYNLIKILSIAKYGIKLKRVNMGYNVIIDISNRSGGKLTNMLNEYLNNFI